MKVTVPQYYPERASNPKGLTHGNHAGKASGQTSTRSTDTSVGPASVNKVVSSRPHDGHFTNLGSAHASQRPVRIGREGEAEALYVYDSLANYQPHSGKPSVDIYI